MTYIQRKVLTEKTQYPKGKVVPAFPVHMEICCDYCNEVIHNHISCPSCGISYASIDAYGDLNDYEIVRCEECGTKYRLVSGGWYADFTAQIV